MDLDQLSDEERFIAKWRLGMQGDFKTALITAIMRADMFNMAKLELGFPVEVKAYKKYSTENGWWQKVEEKLGIEVME